MFIYFNSFELFVVEEHTESLDFPLHEAAKRGNISFLQEGISNKVMLHVHRRLVFHILMKVIQRKSYILLDFVKNHNGLIQRHYST